MTMFSEVMETAVCERVRSYVYVAAVLKLWCLVYKQLWSAVTLSSVKRVLHEMDHFW